MPPPHSTSSCSIVTPSEVASTLCSRCARTMASVTLIFDWRMPSSARRQSSIFSVSGTSNGSRSIGVR